MVERSTGLLAAAIVLISLSVGLVAVSLATEQWLNIVVYRDNIAGASTTDYRFYSRYRGLIRTCFPGDDLAFLDSDPYLVDGWCRWETGYEFSRDPVTITWGDYYTYRIHMMRAQFVVIVLAGLVLLLASLVTGSGCLGGKAARVQAGAIIAAIGGFLVACGMAIFHGIEYIEEEKITAEAAGFPASYVVGSAYEDLATKSITSYGYSYFLGWVAAASAFMGALIGLCTAYQMKLAENPPADDAMALEKPSDYDRGYDDRYDDRGYDDRRYDDRRYDDRGYGDRGYGPNDDYPGYGAYDVYTSAYTRQY
jgi:hypothetical protein